MTKKVLMTAVALAGVGLLAADVWAADAGAKAGGPGRAGVRQRARARWGEILKEYDKDGDGKLSPPERAELRKHRREQLRDRIKAKVDTDGDGRISDAERQAAREKFFENHPQLKERLLKRFDADGDGKLNEQERAKARQALRRHLRGPGRRPAADGNATPEE